MKKMKTHLFLPLWLVFCLVFVQTVAGQMVLCVGSDGHVELEVASGDGQCGEEAFHGCEIACLSADHCGPCQDVMISGDEVNLSKRPVAVVSAYRSCEAFEHLSVSKSTNLHDFPASFHSALLSIQMVVLLI